MSATKNIEVVQLVEQEPIQASDGGSNPTSPLHLCCFCIQRFPSKGALKRHKRDEHLEKLILASKPHATERQEWKKFLDPAMWHPAADLMPMCDGEEFDRLVADVKENGLQAPVVLFQEKVLDGRNRLKACKEAKVNPTFISLDGDSEFNPVSWVLSTNLSRRHLSKSQVACILVDAEELIVRLRAEAKTRQAHVVPSVVELIPQAATSGKTRDKLGAIGGVSGRYVDLATSLKAESPELFQKVKQGALSVTKVMKHLRGGSPTTGKSVDELKKAFKPQPPATMTATELMNWFHAGKAAWLNDITITLRKGKLSGKVDVTFHATDPTTAKMMVNYFGHKVVKA